MSKKTNAYSGSNRQHSFANVPKAEQSRSSFDRSSNYKTTFNSGKLIPFFVEEILPGDTLSCQPSVFARMATPIFPVMDNLTLDFHFLFVACRLVWDKWAFFLGEEETPGDAQLAPKYSIPQVVAPVGGFLEHSTFDYVGVPTAVAAISVSALPFRAINLCYSEWFRDENLQTRPTLRKDGGVITQGTGAVPVVDLVADFPLFSRGKRHDYFTSCLPWPQKGPSVLLPLGGNALVIPLSGASGVPTFAASPDNGDYGPIHKNGSGLTLTAGGPNWNSATNTDLRFLTSGLEADLGGASAATINELRQSFQIQRLLERDARGGSRLTELIHSHFGVKSPDQRLQRPEYLGGGSVDISINPVPQTSATIDTSTPLGELAGYATASGQPGGFTQSFTEHGYVIGFVSVRADLSYQQGLHKLWSRKSRFDFYWPALQNIGEQAVLNKEIYAQGTSADDLAFGYQERWAEYRYRPSMVTGQMRSSSTLSLDSWHLSEDFTALPTLSASFIESKPPVARVIAVPSQPEFIFDAFLKMKHARVMPVYSVPGLIDHF